MMFDSNLGTISTYYLISMLYNRMLNLPSKYLMLIVLYYQIYFHTQIKYVMYNTGYAL